MCRRTLFISLVFLCGCSLSDDSAEIAIFSASFDFSKSQEGWEADFTDLTSYNEDSAFYELKSAYTDLPANLGSQKSIMLSGHNYNGDLFMFIKKKITGLSPNTLYTLVFEVELASNASQGSIGGSSPGKSVFLKAGASEIEPAKIIQNNRYVLNVDKGNQGNAGSNTVLLGDIAIPPSASDYTLISRSNTSSSNQTFIAETNSAGEIWLIVGTDSGFAGTTTLYYTKIKVLFSGPS